MVMMLMVVVIMVIMGMVIMVMMVRNVWVSCQDPWLVCSPQRHYDSEDERQVQLSS